MSNKTTSMFILLVTAVIAGAVLILLMSGFRAVGPNVFFSGGCEGVIEGERCTSADCTPPNKEVVGKILGISNPRCTFFSNETQCKTSYTVGDRNMSVCVWSFVGGNGMCLLNPEISCKDFGALTTPKCEEVPRCKQVSAIENSIRYVLGGMKR